MGGRMTPTERIEAFLCAERADLLEQGIWPSNVVVIDNMLANAPSLAAAYADILTQAPPGTVGTWGEQEAWQRILLAVIDTAAGWAPARIGETREAVRRAAELSEDVAKKARELAALLRAREVQREKHGISGPDDYHPLDVLHLAAERSHQARAYEGWVAPRLASLKADFDLKYWPRTADFLDALADLQEEPAAPHDELDRAAMASRQSGTPREFLRALDAELATIADEDGVTVSLHHRTLAELANAALALPVDELLTPEYIKKYRADRRSRG